MDKKKWIIRVQWNHVIRLKWKNYSELHNKTN